MIRKIKDRVIDKTIKAIDKAGDLSKSVSDSMKCSTCNGIGVVGRLRKKPCKDCDGTGTVIGKMGTNIKGKMDSSE